MSRLRPTRLASLCLAAAATGALWAAPAWPHATATGTQPASGDILDTPPDQVVVEFNEPVTPVDAATGVVAPNGDRADTGIADTDDPATLTIDLDADLEGTYLVGYRVVSHDGHPIAGTYTFSVGHQTEPPGAEALDADTDGLVGALLYTNRWLGYAGLALALGTGVLVTTGARPRAFGARLIAAGLSAVALTAVAGIALQAAYESGVPLTGLEATALQSAMESNVGMAALLRLLIVLIALPLLRGLVTATETPGRPAQAALAAVGLALTATWPLSGHPMASEPVAVAFAADGLHTAAGLTWAGGITALLAHSLKRDADVPERARRAWTALVPWLLATLVVAGLASALLHIDSLEALTDTRYGNLVALKTAVLGLIVAVGLLTRRAVLRGPGAAPALRRLLGVEIVLAGVVLAAVAVLVQAVPAKTALLEGGEASPVETGELAALVTTEAFSGQLVLEPGRPGANAVRILVTGADGEPFEAVAWEAEWGAEGAEPDTLRLVELREGVLGGQVSVPEAGRYVFAFTLTDAGGDSATAEAVLDLELPVAEGAAGVLAQLEAPLLEVAAEQLGQEPGGVGGQVGPVDPAAHRHRRHERRVGLDQHELGRCDRRRRAQRLGVLEGDVPGEAHEEPAAGAFARERLVAREAVQHHSLGRALLVEDRQDVGVGVAVVDDEGLAAAFGDLDVGAQRPLLGVAAALAGAEVVQARLAERGDPVAGGQLVDRGQGRVEVADERRLVRVQRRRGQDPAVEFGQVGGPPGGVDVGADLHQVRDAGRLGPVDQRADGLVAGLGGDRRVGGMAGGHDVEMGVTVADRGRERLGRGRWIGSFHASTMPWRRARLAAAQARCDP
ncbi:hypothetical protein GCM10027447_35560 [Glycomyces halotolerans]